MFFLLPFINEHMDDGLYDVSSKNNSKTTKKSNREEMYVYLLKGDKVLKLYITVDKYLIEKNFKLLKDNLTKKDFTYVYGVEDFNENNFPLDGTEFQPTLSSRIVGKYKIPDKNSLNSTLLYILTDIYNSYRINSEMLYDLCEEYKFRYNECNYINETDKIWIEVIESIVNNLEIQIEEEYDYNDFIKSVNFMEDISKKEYISMIDILYKLKQILNSAKENKEIFENLKININKEKQLIK